MPIPRKNDLTPIMNDTKWDELRLGMYGLGHLCPQWRTCDVESGYVCPWDREWFYHFRGDGYASIEWVEVRVDSPEQSAAVLEVLQRASIPSTKSDFGFKVFGYVATGQRIE